jgi:hypothetical protein
MSLTIKNFKVLNTTSGLMNIDGRKTTEQLNSISSQYTLKNNLTNLSYVEGTPNAINKAILTDYSHFSSSFLKIDYKGEDSNSLDKIDIFQKLRIIFYFGESTSNNMICYAWAHSTTQTLSELEFNVLFANCNAQQKGDYKDIDLPDMIYYPNLYLVLILVNNIWNQRIIEDVTNKICSVDVSNHDYFCIDPSKSVTSNNEATDNNTNHCIVIKGNNSIENKNIRYCIAFEDWYDEITDWDYHDVGLIVTDQLNDENQVIDNILS